jgi:hypothetical protein
LICFEGADLWKLDAMRSGGYRLAVEPFSIIDKEIVARSAETVPSEK